MFSLVLTFNGHFLKENEMKSHVKSRYELFFIKENAIHVQEQDF